MWVNIHVGFEPPPDPLQPFTPNFVRVRALLDTGSDATVIGPELSAGREALRDVNAHNMRGAGFAGVYSALVQIDQLDKPYHIEVGSAPLKSVTMALGRDMLSKYKLVIDTPTEEFYLEHVSA